MALPLSNHLKFKILGSYELHHRLRHAVLWASLLGSPFFLGLIAGWVFGIRVNLTPSLPFGFYITGHSSNANLVEFCPQGNAAYISLTRQYRTAGPWPYGTYKVEPGTVWVVSSFNSYSFDSRYYGAIPTSAIRHHLRPLWTFATEAP